MLIKYQTYGRDAMEKWEIDKLERERMIKKPKPKSNFVGYIGV